MATDRNRFAASIFVLLIITGFATLASAQTPPAAPPAVPPPPPPQTEGSAEFAFVGTTGNSSTQTLGLGGELIYRPTVWETRFKVNFVRNKAEDQLRAQAFNLMMRAQRPIRPRLSGFGQYSYQRDRFAGILDRNVIEGGVAYTAVDEAPHKLLVDASLGYASEQRLLGDNLSTATLGTGGLYTLKISDTSDLSEDAHFNFSLSQGSDWRFANLVSLTAKVTTIFSVKVSNTVRYLNLPVAGFKNTDAITSVAMVAKF